jgi:hypothetical protein
MQLREQRGGVTDGKASANADAAELRAIQSALDRMEQCAPPAAAERAVPPRARGVAKENAIPGVGSSEVSRLQRMRDEFVRSGTYVEGDRVLVLLSEKIAQLSG